MVPGAKGNGSSSTCAAGVRRELAPTTRNRTVRALPAGVYPLVPKVGPFRAFKFSVPTPEAERLFLESFTSTREHFKQSLDALSAGRLDLSNTNFDTGQPTKRGEYSMADDAYDALLEKLADRKFANVSNGLRTNLAVHYGDVSSLATVTDAPPKRLETIRKHLAMLDAVTVRRDVQWDS